MKRLILACLLLAIPNESAYADFSSYIKAIPGLAKQVVILKAAQLAKDGLTMAWNRFLIARGFDQESINADAHLAGSASQKRLPEMVTTPVPIAPGTIPQAIEERIARLQRKDYSWPTCRPLLLTGLPGSGKTQLGRFLAQQTGCPLVYESAAGIYAGIENSGTESIYALFKRARRRPFFSSLVFGCKKALAWILRKPQPKRTPTVIILDEFDAIGQPAPANQLLAGDRPLEVEREKAFNRLLWEVGSNPHKQANQDKRASWMRALPHNHLLRVILSDIPEGANLVPHYSCPPADLLEKTVAASFHGPAVTAAVVAMQLAQLRAQNIGVTPERLQQIQTQSRQIAEEIARAMPADSIIPFMNIMLGGNLWQHMLEEPYNYQRQFLQQYPDLQHRLRITQPPLFQRIMASVHGWLAKKELQLIYWMRAKDETDALVIATSNKQAHELDPRIHEFFEVREMQPLTAEQRMHVLQFHAQGKHLSAQVNLQATAERTAGFTGDELAAVVNEAALQAATLQHQEISPDDIGTAMEEQFARRAQAPAH